MRVLGATAAVTVQPSDMIGRERFMTKNSDKGQPKDYPANSGRTGIIASMEAQKTETDKGKTIATPMECSGTIHFVCGQRGSWLQGGL